MQQRYTAESNLGKGGKARQELTGMTETSWPCKPYPKQHQQRAIRLPVVLLKAWLELLGRPTAKIDRCQIQNPAYMTGRFSNKKTLLAKVGLFFDAKNKAIFNGAGLEVILVRGSCGGIGVGIIFNILP